MSLGTTEYGHECECYIQDFLITKFKLIKNSLLFQGRGSWCQYDLPQTFERFRAVFLILSEKWYAKHVFVLFAATLKVDLSISLLYISRWT